MVFELNPFSKKLKKYEFYLLLEPKKKRKTVNGGIKKRKLFLKLFFTIAYIC